MLRIAGLDYDGIATQLKTTRPIAEKHVAAELEKLRQASENTTALDLARLSQMLMYLWPKVKEGDVKAISEAREIMDRIRDQEAKTEPEKESELDKRRRKRQQRLGTAP